MKQQLFFAIERGEEEIEMLGKLIGLNCDAPSLQNVYRFIVLCTLLR